jgi:hypothetical protein
VSSERTTISRDAVPRVSFEVRRRRYGDRRWLVRHNDIYEIDPVTDAVWLGCAEGLTVQETIHRVAQAFELPIADAITQTVEALSGFSRLGFVEFDAMDGGA